MIRPQSHDLGLVLVHGGCHTAACWEPVLPHLSCPALAVDLPGRRGRPGELAELRVGDFARAIAEDVERSTLPQRIVLVGHSLAGLTLPAAAALLRHRVQHLVFVSCYIPPEGMTLTATLPPLARFLTGRLLRRGVLRHPGRWQGRYLFSDRLWQVEASGVAGGLVDEAAGVFTEPVSRRDMPPVALTYVSLLKDRALSPAVQLRQVANLGGARVVVLDSGHDVMTSHPRDLAAVLNGVAATSGLGSPTLG